MIDPVKKVLEVFSKNKLWDEGVELIGSWCFLLYQKHCGAKPYPLRTQDIDFLISLPYRSKREFNVGDALENIGFKVGFKRNGSVYYWTEELMVEFLVPERGKGTDHAIRIQPLSLRATPLRFVSTLLEDPVTVIEEGVPIKIPNPLNFCLHKFLIAQRRMKPDKKQKDIEQAVYTLSALTVEDFANKFRTLPKKWRGLVMKSLKQASRIVPLESAVIERFRNSVG